MKKRWDKRMLLLFLIFLLPLLSHPSGTASPVIMTNVRAGAGSGCERTDPRRSSCWWRNSTSERQSRGIRWWNACQRSYRSPLKVRGSGSFMQLTFAECPSCARCWRCMVPIWKLLWNSLTRRRKRHSSLPPGCSGSRNNYYLYIVTLYLD